MYNFNAVSISYRNADVNIRKMFAFSEQTQKKFLHSLKAKGCSQAVLICTCNRCEVYFSDIDFFPVIDLLSEFSCISSDRLSTFIMSFSGKKAVRHLFRVACGIDSMVIGEDQILGQTKSAFSFSQEMKMTGYEFNTIFKGAITCAKKIKTKTNLSRTSVSPATLAGKLCYETCRNIENPKVLVIGASGKTGSIVLKNLISYGIFSVTATVRTHGIDFVSIGKKDIKTIPYDERYNFMDSCDCIISATSGPHFTITADKFSQSISVQKNRLLIDLAVPPDIDRNVKKVSDKIKLVGIDYFENLAKENNQLKEKSVADAEEYICEDIDELSKNLDFHAFLPKLECIEKKSSKDLIFHLKSKLNSEEFHSVLMSLEDFSEV